MKGQKEDKGRERMDRKRKKEKEKERERFHPSNNLDHVVSQWERNDRGNICVKSCSIFRLERK